MRVNLSIPIHYYSQYIDIIQIRQKTYCNCMTLQQKYCTSNLKLHPIKFIIHVTATSFWMYNDSRDIQYTYLLSTYPYVNGIHMLCRVYSSNNQICYVIGWYIENLWDCIINGMMNVYLIGIAIIRGALKWVEFKFSQSHYYQFTKHLVSMWQLFLRKKKSTTHFYMRKL